MIMLETEWATYIGVFIISLIISFIWFADKSLQLKCFVFEGVIWAILIYAFIMVTSFGGCYIINWTSSNIQFV